MAAGLFGNIYDVQTAQQNQLAAEARGTGEGWAAMTTAARELGGAIGQGVGRAFGGVTPQEQKMEELNNIMTSVPNFDPTNPEQIREMSSKLWTGGFYDEGMNMLKESYEMQKVDALMQYYKDQGQALLAKGSQVTPPKRDTGITQNEYDIALGLVEKNFDTSFFDLIDPDLPAGASKEGLAQFIAQTARNTNSSLDQVINLIKSGELKFTQGTTAASTAPAGSSNVSTTPLAQNLR
jgi:hypothetical protein